MPKSKAKKSPRNILTRRQKEEFLKDCDASLSDEKFNQILQFLTSGHFDIGDLFPYKSYELPGWKAAAKSSAMGFFKFLINRKVDARTLCFQWAVGHRDKEVFSRLFLSEDVSNFPTLSYHCKNAIAYAVYASFEQGECILKLCEVKRSKAILRDLVDYGAQINNVPMIERCYYFLCQAILDNSTQHASWIVDYLNEDDKLKFEINQRDDETVHLSLLCIFLNRPEIFNIIFSFSHNAEKSYETFFGEKYGMIVLRRILDDKSYKPEEWQLLGKCFIKYALVNNDKISIKSLLQKGYSLNAGEVLDLLSMQDSIKRSFNIDMIKMLFEYDERLGDSSSKKIALRLAMGDMGGCCNCGSFLVTLVEHGLDPNLLYQDARSEEWLHYCWMEDSACPLYRYFAKMQLVDDSYAFERQWIFVGYDELSPMVFDIDRTDFEKELTVMRNTQLSISTSSSKGVSLFEFIFLKPTRKARLTRNTNLLEIYKKSKKNFSNSYPHYGFLINNGFRHGSRRRNLIDSLDDLLYTASGTRLTSDMLDEVTSYFNNENLMQICANNL